MSQRTPYMQTAPEVLHAMRDLQLAVTKLGFAPAFLELLCLRASQLNGCAFCLDMHAKELRAKGESDLRIDLLPVWREVSFYTDRERAALAWTEALTRLGEHGVPDELYETARAHFSEAELAKLTLAIVAINGWNRLQIAFQIEAGHYKAGTKAAALAASS